MPAKIIDELMMLGFTRYEALGYVALLRRSPLTGYELAKLSGVPRANIYEVLARLQERGAVMRADDESTARFVPVSSDELIDHLRRSFERTIRDAEAGLSEIGENTRWDPVMNTQGYASTMTLARKLVASTRRELLLGVWPQEAEVLAEVMQEADERKVRITTLCLAGCGQGCGFCRGEVHRYRVLPGRRSRWLVLSSDGHEVLTAEIQNEDAVAVRTRQRLLVELASWYIRHTIAVAALVRDLDTHEGPPLSKETKAILRSIGSGEADRDWLAQVRTMIESSGDSVRQTEATNRNKHNER